MSGNLLLIGWPPEALTILSPVPQLSRIGLINAWIAISVLNRPHMESWAMSSGKSPFIARVSAMLSVTARSRFPLHSRHFCGDWKRTTKRRLIWNLSFYPRKSSPAHCGIRPSFGASECPSPTDPLRRCILPLVEERRVQLSNLLAIVWKIFDRHDRIRCAHRNTGSAINTSFRIDKELRRCFELRLITLGVDAVRGTHVHTQRVLDTRIGDYVGHCACSKIVAENLIPA